MCGIFGISGPADPELLLAMAERLHHRGPDSRGRWASPRMALGANRLAIVGVSNGEQPFFSEDERFVLVFNGEIYNFRALRQELERRGHRFATAADGEVIVHLFEDEGEAALGRLEGMFALALWDEHDARLLLARDRHGMKTLCYTEHEGRFAFASEIKGLLCLPDLPRRLDTDGLASMVALSTIAPGHTLLEGISQLPAASLLSWQSGTRPQLRRYWTPRVDGSAAGGEEVLAAELERRLVRAVESHLAHEVPMGAALSGGIDSSTVVAVMSTLLDRPVKTYNVVFPGDVDETPWARMVAEHCRTDHREVTLGGEGFMRRLPSLLWTYEEPDSGPQIAHDILFAQAAREVKVILLGEGADEIFGGYPRFKTACGAPAWLPSRLGRDAYLLAQRGSSRPGMRGPRLQAPIARALEEGSLQPVFARHGESRGQGLLAYEQAERLASGHLLRVDRVAMSHSLEARLPYLDPGVVDFVNALPLRMKTRWRGEKHLLRRVARRFLPAPVVHRAKWGLRNPLRTWMHAGLLDLARDLLSPELVAARGCFSPAAVQRLLRRVTAGRPLPFDLMHLNLLVLVEGWHRVFIDPVRPGPPPDDLLLPRRG